MCRFAGNRRSWEWLVRSAAFVSCLHFAAIASASCGHYVFTKFEWIAAVSGPSGSLDANLRPIEQFCRDMDQMRANPRFSNKYHSPTAPCRGPGCRQLPENSTIATVPPNPVRLNGLEMISTGLKFEFPRSCGFDSIVEPRTPLSIFVDEFFRPPRF